jgi:hypothetical protein
MNNEFVIYEQALALKELGFDESCLVVYNIHTKSLFSTNINTLENQPKNSDLSYPSTTAPLKQQVFKWFRDIHQIFASINVDQTLEPKFCYSISQYYFSYWKDIVFNSDLYYTYEEAESACIDKLIELVKNK